MSALAQRRSAALAAFSDAKDDPAADWRRIAETLAELVPAPKAAICHAADGEWSDDGYAAKLTKANYQRGRAVFRFEDGRNVVVNLLLRKGKKAPDWARAVRFAVRFYRRGQRVAVPRLIEGMDIARGVRVSPTMMRKEAARFLATLPAPVDRRGVPDYVRDDAVEAFRVCEALKAALYRGSEPWEIAA